VRLLATLLVCLAFLYSLSADHPRVELVRPPAFVAEDEMIVIQVRVRPSNDNRLLALTADDGAFIVRRSDEDLTEESPRTRWVRWILPEGRYTLAATVFTASGQRARDTSTLTVLGR